MRVRTSPRTLSEGGSESGARKPRIAAHNGTAARLGEMAGIGDGLGETVGVGLVVSDGDGLVRADELADPQPASASSAARATTPTLTGIETLLP
jgi:hypothetical protein